MFSTSSKAATTAISSGNNTDATLQLPPQSLPDSYSLAQFYDELVDKSSTKDNQLATLLILNGCLNSTDRLQRTNGDETYVTKLSLWVSKAILPNGNNVAQDEGPEQNSDASRAQALIATHQKGDLGLQALSKLFDLQQPSSDTPLNVEIIVSLLAFTSARDAWTTPSSLSTAQYLLSLPSIQSQLHKPDLISTTLLQSFIRPLFSASKASTVTAAGRKAMPSSAPPKRHDFTVSERLSKPWKYGAVYSIPVLEWAIENISDQAIPTTWHLFIPPLLTLLDDPSTPILTRGLSLITTFLPHLSPRLLNQTGLSSVFEDAILPILLHVPTITSLSESLLLLPAAYTTLFALCDVRYPPGDTPTSQSQKERIAFLDRVMRQGVLLGYFHANEHPALVSVLVAAMATLVKRMGVFAVKHLKDILPILSAVLTDPFGGARLEGLSGALKTLNVVLLNCWARIGEPLWRVAVVKALVVCWRTLGEDCEADGDEDVLVRVRGEARMVGRVFVKAVGGVVDMRKELEPLFKVNPAMAELFGFEDE